MTEQTTTAQNNLFNLAGTVSGIESKIAQGPNKTPYFKVSFSTTLKGKPVKMTAMGFGKAFHAVIGSLTEGASVRLNGFFAAAPEGGRTFTVVGLGKEPKAPEAAAA